MYFPFVVHCQAMESSISGSSWTSWILIHMEINSSSCVASFIFPRSALIQVLLCNSWITGQFLRLTRLNSLFDTRLYSFGASVLGAAPCSQLPCQNLAFLPFPTVSIMDALKSRRSVASQGVSMPTQGLESSTHSNHNQHNLRAHPYFVGPRYLVRRVSWGISPFPS